MTSFNIYVCIIFQGFFNIYCCWSVTQLCLSLCDPMDCSTADVPVLHYLLEFAQTHVRWLGDAIRPSHPLLPLSSPALSLSQHQGRSQWVWPHQVAKVLELQLQSFQWMNIQGWSPLGLTGLISLQFQRTLKRLLQHHSSEEAFFGTQPSLWSNSHIPTWLLAKP